MEPNLAIRLIIQYLQMALLKQDATGYDSGLADHIREDLQNATVELTNLVQRIDQLEVKLESLNNYVRYPHDRTSSY